MHKQRFRRYKLQSQNISQIIALKDSSWAAATTGIPHVGLAVVKALLQGFLVGLATLLSRQSGRETRLLSIISPQKLSEDVRTWS
ncbi:hypothetical protein Hamer_G011653 [Homarus americanus]|uniref:Uncharacterized protein n=1 Tax=Homarus americanus TaxID=6706 RepID=A0A8J5MYA5_HOMAM|nr:hypothetical protein Hamer_G011653 [Homarus americanus]